MYVFDTQLLGTVLIVVILGGLGIAILHASFLRREALEQAAYEAEIERLKGQPPIEMAIDANTTFTFRHDGLFWTTALDLPAFTGFNPLLVQTGPYNEFGTVELSLSSPQFSKDSCSSFTTPVKWFLKNQTQLLENVLSQAILAANHMSEITDWYEAPEFGKDLAYPSSAVDVKHLMQPDQIIMSSSPDRSEPIIEFYFECAWDREHGFHVVTDGLTVAEP